MAAKRRAHGPRALAAALPAVTKRMFKAQGFAEGRVLTQWADIVGRPLADHCCPERLGPDGVLRVRVAGAWAVELSHLEPLVLERIAGYFGYRAVERLVLVQGPLPVRDAPAAPRPRPLDAAEAERLDGEVAAVEDPDVRAALTRLGRAVFGTARRT